LAARIGQSLLKQNKALTERNKLLDEQMEITKEEVIIENNKKKVFACLKKIRNLYLFIFYCHFKYES